MKKSESQIEPSFCEQDHEIFFRGETVCPHCGAPLSVVPPQKEDEISTYSREAHNRDIDGYNRTQNALCYLVIGGTVFIIGVLFVFLSLEKKYNKIVGINPASFPFVIAMLCLAAGLTALTLGTIFLVKARRIRSHARQEIELLASYRCKNGQSS
jgi:hypothetical protein